ncbi:MAG TPA: hypothetical protein VHB77_07030 [Planctomycetaceae bacterium]|nr:hypothetical protein [Planctomycetaceae bacterium]
MHPSETPEPELASSAELGTARGLAAREYGQRMIIAGVVICLCAACGLTFQFGLTGTLVVGASVFAVGVGALGASMSPRAANITALLVQVLLWTMIAAMALIVLASIVGFIYFLVAPVG